MNIVIYGGNGFVGTRVAEVLSRQQHQVTVVSRRGKKPVQLEGEPWAETVDWVAGDAGSPEDILLQQQQVVISTVGAPPLPTFSEEAYNKSLNTNGLVNVKLIEAAQRAGVERFVLLGAKIPTFLQRDSFAYAKGKRLALEAARQFSETKPASAVVIQPGNIYGKRYTATGSVIHLDVVMGPLSKVLPSLFVSVEALAQCMADAATGQRATGEAFTVIANNDI